MAVNSAAKAVGGSSKYNSKTGVTTVKVGVYFSYFYVGDGKGTTMSNGTMYTSEKGFISGSRASRYGVTGIISESSLTTGNNFGGSSSTTSSSATVSETNVYGPPSPDIMMSKKYTVQPDSGLQGISDEEISRRARDKSLSGEERKRYQTEEKVRGIRNKQKRNANFENIDEISPETVIVIVAAVAGAATAGATAGAGAAAGFPFFIHQSTLDFFELELRNNQSSVF